MNRCPCGTGIPLNNPAALVERLIECVGYIEAIKCLKAHAERDSDVKRTDKRGVRVDFCGLVAAGLDQALHHVSPTTNGGIH